MTNIRALRHAYAAAVEKAAQQQEFFEAGRCRGKQRDASRKAAQIAAEAYHAVALGGTARIITARQRPPATPRKRHALTLVT